MLTQITKLHITSRFYSANETQIHNLTLYFIVRYSTALIPSCPKGVTMIANRPKAVFFIRPSKFENGRPKDGWTVGWLRPCCKYRYCMFFAFQVFRLCNNNINITLHILIGCCAAIKLIENKHGLETRQKSLCYVLVHVHTLEICALSQ